ncbi:class I SAM-dependent methyltransferase [Christiangramia echinicola]|uniref:Methyltransferase domain-containing protein n=1 Tax=Christiangramia echinicola TaxID=279359 RepID=A0A1H1PS04_9FLAO|nr:class I SAM-dependent methyltransferase [Christiangramia echinicola]SDS13948.1 Methyltransferase domain-containing protein [Christiangramia echinicola]
MDKNKDIFGTAIKAFYKENDPTDIIVHSPDFDNDIIPIDYLFRAYEDMPGVEQKALDLCRGKVLDVGCGAGSHALFLQNERNLDIKAIDTSPGAIEIAEIRGVKETVCQDFYEIENEKFDTILMLMNGSGIIGKLKNLNLFFEHSRTVLNEGGQILMDSSDLIYLFEDEKPDLEKYYGELEYKLSYKNAESDYFDWLYIDARLLEEKAKEHNFRCEIIQKGEHFDYLAILNPL